MHILAPPEVPFIGMFVKSFVFGKERKLVLLLLLLCSCSNASSPFKTQATEMHFENISTSSSVQNILKQLLPDL